MHPWRVSLVKFHLSTGLYGKGHVCMHVCTVPEHVESTRQLRVSFPFCHPCYLRQGLSLDPELARCMRLTGYETQESACLCLWSMRLYKHAAMPSFSIWVLVTKVKSTCPHGKPSTRWAIFLVPDKVLLCYNIAYTVKSRLSTKQHKQTICHGWTWHILHYLHSLSGFL